MKLKYSKYIISLSIVAVLFVFYSCSVKKRVGNIRDTLYVAQSAEIKRVIRDTLRDATIVLEYIPDSVGAWKASKKTVTMSQKNFSGNEEEIKSEEIQKEETKIFSETKSRGYNKKWIWLLSGVLISLTITIILLIRFR